MGQFWIWSKNLQIRLKCVIGAFSFSSKNTSMSLEPLSRSWQIIDSQHAINKVLDLCIPTAINNQLTFILQVLFQYLFNVFCSADIWVLHHHNTDMYNQLCMYNHLHMFPPYSKYIHFEKLLLDNESKEYALYIHTYTSASSWYSVCQFSAKMDNLTFSD